MFGLFCLILVGYELRWFLGCRAQATVRVWDNGRKGNELYDASRKSVCEGSTFSPAPPSARLQPGGGLQLDALFQVCQAGQLRRYKGSAILNSLNPGDRTIANQTKIFLPPLP